MQKLDALIDGISEGMDLSPTEREVFRNLADAWEKSTETMADIEPDGNFSEDAPLLPVLEKQESRYDILSNAAPQTVKDAMEKYLKLRGSYLEPEQELDI